MFGYGKNAHNITLYDLKVFSCLAEGRSLSAVSRRMSVSPSKVSRCIERLEEAFGAELFSSGREFGLTDQGWKLLKHMEIIESNLRNVERIVHRERNKGRCLTIFAKEHFHKIIYQALNNIGFKGASSGGSVNISSWTNDCVDELRMQNIDMVISKEINSCNDLISIPVAISNSYYLVKRKQDGKAQPSKLEGGLVIFDFAEHNRAVHPVEDYLTRVGKRDKLKAKLSNIKHIEKRICKSGETALISSDVLLSSISNLDEFDVVNISDHYKVCTSGNKFRDAIIIAAHINRDSHQRELLELLAKEIRVICDNHSKKIDNRYRKQSQIWVEEI